MPQRPQDPLRAYTNVTRSPASAALPGSALEPCCQPGDATASPASVTPSLPRWQPRSPQSLAPPPRTWAPRRRLPEALGVLPARTYLVPPRRGNGPPALQPPPPARPRRGSPRSAPVLAARPGPRGGAEGTGRTTRGEQRSQRGVWARRAGTGGLPLDGTGCGGGGFPAGRCSEGSVLSRCDSCSVSDTPGPPSLGFPSRFSFICTRGITGIRRSPVLSAGGRACRDWKNTQLGLSRPERAGQTSRLSDPP